MVEQKVKVIELVAGAKLIQPVYSEAGQLLVPAPSVLTPVLIERLKQVGILEVLVEGTDPPLEVESPDRKAESLLKNNMDKVLEYRFSRLEGTFPKMLKQAVTPHVLTNAHFFSKYFDPQSLDQLLQIHQTENKEKIIQKISTLADRMAELPTLPSIIKELQKYCANPNVSATRIENLIKQDPALSAKILRLVNSAYFGMPQKVHSIAFAVVIVGIVKVYQLSVSTSVLTMFKGKLSKMLDYTRFWEFSVAAGCATEAAAEVLLPQATTLTEGAFLIGLLHDVGKLFLALHFRYPFEKAVEATLQRKMYLSAALKDILGVDTAEAGYVLLKKWELPDLICDAIRLYEAPVQEGKMSEAAGLLHLGVIVAKTLNVGDNADYFIYPLAPDIQKHFDLNSETLNQIVKRTVEKLQKADTFFELIHKG